jgi:ATP-dependent exoDNAse (exonuclease V) alpha subunit
MAIFHLDIKPVTRSTGRSATSAAAYRAGESIRDERTGALYNHSKRADVLHKEIILPAKLEGPQAGMEWARDRATLWNTAEKTERQSNSRVAREYLAALPAELSPEGRVTLARAFSREIADRYNVAVDLAIHEPRPGGDPRNFHAHLLATTREVSPEGLGAKTGIDMTGAVRSELGLPPSREEFRTLRSRWAQLTNAALHEANSEARVDHRSLEAQGIDREPRPRLPWAAIAAQRRGERSEVADRIRERQRTRMAARERSEAAAPQEPGPRQAAQEETAASRESTAPADMAARRRQAVEDWLRYRAGQAQQSGSQSAEDVRRRAVEAWKSLQARGAESPPPAAAGRARGAAREGGETEPGRDPPGLGEDLSG